MKTIWTEATLTDDAGNKCEVVLVIDYWPAGGDGWTEPFYDASFEVRSMSVKSGRLTWPMRRQLEDDDFLMGLAEQEFASQEEPYYEEVA